MGTTSQPVAEQRPVVRWVERTLGLLPGDLGRSALPFFYLYVIITGYVVGKVARDALFLARFQAVRLPYADIATAVLVGFVVAAYVRLGRRTGIRNLLIASAVFFSSNCVLAWALAIYHPTVWLYPVLYVWVGIFGVLAPAQVWTLANYIYTAREGRRLFGVIGSGAIAGWISAGYLSKLLVQKYGTYSLLLAMALLLLVSGGIVYLIWRQSGERAQQNGNCCETDQPRNLRESMAIVWDSPYLRSIAGVICFSSLVTAIVGWQFKALAKVFFTRQDSLAIFFGDFNFYAGLLSLGVQLLLTSRMLRRFGMGPALFVVPFALLTGSMAILFSGALFSVVLIKGCDQVLRYSIDKSTVELLYLPLPARIKFQVKWFIDTVIWRFGDGLAGVLVLVFTTYLGVSARGVSWLVVALLAGWMVSAFLAKRMYGTTLASSIREHRLELERASAAVFDRDTTQVLLSKLSGPEESDVLYALGIFEVERRRTPHPAIRGLLDHPAAAIRRKALSILGSRGDIPILKKAEEMLRDPDLQVRTEALLVLSHYQHIDPLHVIEELGDFKDYSVRASIAAYLAHPGPGQNLVAAHALLQSMALDSEDQVRLEAARILGNLPDRFDSILGELLADADNRVVIEAIRSAALLRKHKLVPELLEKLVKPETAEPAVDALTAFGDRIVGTLGDHLCDEHVCLELRRRIPMVLGAIPSPESARLLENALLECDTGLRRNALTALNRLVHHHPELHLNAEAIENILLAELVGHYRSYQILFALEEGVDENIQHALDESMTGERERIFRLLSLLYPVHDFESAYYALQSSNHVIHDNALEFLEDVLKPDLRHMLVPLLDAQVSLAERAHRADILARISIDSREDAVAALIGSDDPWLRSCGAYTIGRLGMKAFEEHLNRCMEDADPLLRQAAREAKVRLAK